MTKNNKIISAIICLFSIFLGTIIIITGLNQKVKPIYNYKVQKDDDYEVLLKPNNFYTTDTLKEDKYYVSNSIKSYLIKFKYNFYSENSTDIDYNYNVTATLIGKVEDNVGQYQEIWSRDFILNEKNNKLLNYNEFNINEPVNIDYEYYKNLVNEYRKNYNIVINATLRVRFSISYNINLSSFNSKDEYVKDFIELNIPITNSISYVEKNYSETNSKDIMGISNNKNIIKFVLIIVGSIFILFSIIALLILNKDKFTKRTTNLKHILKYYNNLIINVKKEPDLSNLIIIEVNTINDLIDIAEQTQNNIIHYKIQNENINKFYLIKDNYAYIFNYI